MTGRLGGVWAVACGGLWMAAIVGCAASSGMHAGGEGAAMSIAEVRVAKEGTTTVVTLLGLEQPVFTAFQQEDPDRVIIDLASVAPSPLQDPVAVYDGLVEEVSMAPFSAGTGDPMTRVEISLSAPALFKAEAGEEGLVIRIDGDPGLAEATSPEGEEIAETTTSDDPWAAAPMAPMGGAGESSAPVATPTAEMPATASAPATKLLAIEVEKTAEGTMLHLRANGSLPSAETFPLTGPSRLVIDLPGLESAVAKNTIEVGSPRVARVRVGHHDKLVRVVVDAGDAADAFEGRRVVPTADGLVVALGQGSELDEAVSRATSAPAPMLAASAPAEAVPSAPDAAAAATDSAAAAAGAASEASGPVTIYGVEFDAQDARDRIVVLGERPIEYIVYEPDPETLVLSFEQAAIDPEAAVRITPEAGGPVSLVTAFAQPESKTSEVRVVVKRAAGLKPEITRRGALLVVDFPRTGAVATAPPMLEPGVAGATTEVGSLPAGSANSPTDVAAEESNLPHVPAPAAAGGAAQGQAGPASLEPPAAISMLQEGGLIDGKQYAGRRISLDFKDVEIADVLRLIAEVSDLNVIAGDEVKGKVTIRLIDVPWDQALDVILLTKGLGFMRVGNVLRIASADVLSKEEEARLQERRAKEKLEDLVVKLQPVNYAKVNDVSVVVRKLLTARGTVDIDKRTSTLIIKDIASVIDEATALIKAIDTQTPQVMIESKIVEASLDFSREFGVTWGIGNPLIPIGNEDFSMNNNSEFTNPVGGSNGLYDLAASIWDDKIDLHLTLQAAEANGDGKVISSPRLVTLDNSPAKIEQGVSIPFQTFENGDAQLEFVDAVLSLNVTPHITADRSIIMKVKVSRNAPDESIVTLTGSPAIRKNQVDTETLVKDGQTLVIGGIYVVDTSDKQSRVPYLHSIPLLGALFRSDSIVDSRKELLIFITPRIVVGPAVAS